MDKYIKKSSKYLRAGILPNRATKVKKDSASTASPRLRRAPMVCVLTPQGHIESAEVKRRLATAIPDTSTVGGLGLQRPIWRPD
ncbi:hypothetical protein PAAG_12512 [Paracoccidioides lutzii Pb01]|uniref:Uncharacterized protein n=1 Tax=Paracoccidioides lutzii (strain ATCC MYA-826 / Pb01) TaxID=502779 RepID=A0A0A2V365_PARBA|nr:hypothetical protein PAAG_12512 [Paracoccidioides lutzii Pb01]KGQ00817.1 hypothetical protein PAAG_12512 [Paracoccidioides lutzii Pb01]